MKEQMPLKRKLNLKIVNTKQLLIDAIKDIKSSPYISYDTETSGLDPWAPGAWVTSLGISTPKTDWQFPLNHRKSKIYQDISAQKKLIHTLNNIVKTKKKIAQNGKFDFLWLKVHFGVSWYIYFDTMLAHYNLDENAHHGLKEMTVNLGWSEGYDIPLSYKNGRKGSLKIHCEYLGKDTFYTLNLFLKYKKMIAQDFGTSTIFWKITMPTCRVYCDAQYRGVYIDKAKLDDAKLYWEEKRDNARNTLNKLYPKINDEFFRDKCIKAYMKKKNIKPDTQTLNELIQKVQEKGWKNKLEDNRIEHGVNWGSPQQLAYILFEEEGLDPIKSTPKGKHSTDESVLKQLSHQNKIPKLVLDYREAIKNIGTFINGWATKLDKSRIHPNFKIHGTVTGRPSCEDPNLQQTPRDPRIRSLITAPKGRLLLDVDYSQAELRITAHSAKDRVLLQTYQTGGDVHSKTVSDIFGIPPEKQSKEQRKKGKAINFGFIYGMWWKKFIQYALDNYDTVFTEKEAENIRKDFFKLYKDLPAWHKRQKQFAARNGYVRNLLGRMRRLPDAQIPEGSSYNPKREEALRQAINSPIQSFASDLTLMAAIQISKDLKGLVEIVGSVHDSILMEIVDLKKTDYICKTIIKIMERPKLLDELGVELLVPLEGEIELGPWGAATKWKST